MKLLFKQRMWSWFDSYDIYNEDNSVAYTVKGKMAWGHKLVVYDKDGNEVATLIEKIFTFLPKFEIWVDGDYIGCIKKEFSFFKPKFTIEYKDWDVDGEFWEWDYQVTSPNGLIATISKILWRWTDTYSIDVVNDSDGLSVLLLVLAIDAEKCSRSN